MVIVDIARGCFLSGLSREISWKVVEKSHHLTMVCSAVAGPEVSSSMDAVKEANAAPDLCRRCLAQRPVFHRVGAAAGKGGLEQRSTTVTYKFEKHPSQTGRKSLMRASI